MLISIVTMATMATVVMVTRKIGVHIKSESFKDSSIFKSMVTRIITDCLLTSA